MPFDAIRSKVWWQLIETVMVSCPLSSRQKAGLPIMDGNTVQCMEYFSHALFVWYRIQCRIKTPGASSHS
jgi:hypothetical protein